MIIFEHLTFQNFLSVGNNPVTIKLNDHKTTLIHGENGSGKSLLLDALCYSLFNKPFRAINLPQLLNSSNKKGLMTEVVFTIGNKKYTVQRGMKPKKFIIAVDDEPLNAQANDRDNQAYLENNILKMNMKTFIQVVILGSGNYMPFMQLGNLARRECIEDFLDIKVFSTMAVLAREKQREVKDKLNEVKGEIGNLEYKIELQDERVKELIERGKSDIQTLQDEISDTRDAITKVESLSRDYQDKDKVVLEEVQELMKGSPKKMHREYNNVIIKMDGKLGRIKNELEFYASHEECPTCTQTISEDIKNSITLKNEEEYNIISGARNKASTEYDKYASVLDQILEKEQTAMDLQNKIHKCQTQIDTFQKDISNKEKKIAAIMNSSSEVDSAKDQLQKLQEEFRVLTQQKDDYVQQVNDHNIVVNLLKDSGIKTQVVRKYMPVINKSIRKYLTSLEFPVLFLLDEQFNEKVCSPIYQDFSYGSFSEGQKARIDLSLMFTWRDVGRIKNSVSTNILILDEVFSSSLDNVGKQGLLALLRYGLDDNQRVVVVDHTLSQEFKDKFDNSIEVTKVKGFSRYNQPPA